VKGHGVDCAMSLIEWFSACGVIERFDPRPYSQTWFLHRSEELFLNIIEKFAVRLPEGESALPADVALYKHGRCVSHGALIVDDAFVVHACSIARKVERRERNAMTYAFHSFWRVIPNE
ncbi:MAG: hydrolase, partial [Acidimicrobiales bacterium]